MFIYQGSEVSSSHDRNPILSSRPEHLMPNNVFPKLLLQLQIVFVRTSQTPGLSPVVSSMVYIISDIDHEISPIFGGTAIG